MATLPSYFVTALSNIEPEDDKANAALAHKEVRKVLNADPRLQDLGIDPVLIGSYKRNVSIKRVKDVDVFARMGTADDKLSPGKALDMFEEILADKSNFGSERVDRQARSIKVDFPDYGLTVDAVPARPCGDHWEVPNRPEDVVRAQWIETNPTKLTKLTTEANEKYLLIDQGIYVPIVKLMRQVRRTWLKDHPGGLFCEIMTYWAFNNGDFKAKSIAEYLTLALEGVAELMKDVIKDGLNDPTLLDSKITTKATDADLKVAMTQFKAAAALAREALIDADDCSSAVKWKKLLGKTSEEDDVFPTPSYCNTDGTRKDSTGGQRTHDSASDKDVNDVMGGAVRVPAGNGRYA